MKIISWNVNGIRSVYAKGFVTSIKNIDPDIICLQEIKANPEQFPQEIQAFAGYELYVNSAQKKGYSGVCVLTKLKPLRVERAIGFERFDTEGRMLKLDFTNFTLINVYIPNGARDKVNMPYKLEFYDVFTEYLKKIVDKPVIVVGDFNIAHEELDLARPKENVNNTMFTLAEREKLQQIYDLGYIDAFRVFNTSPGNYSWWAYFKGLRERNIGWRIDYTFVSPSLKPKLRSASIFSEVYGADHCPVGIDLEI